MTKVVIALVLLAVAQPPGRYQFDAAGRAVRIDQAWELRSGGDAIAVFMSAARCGRDIFLSDTQNNVFRVDTDLDGTGDGASRGWLASQGISTKVALYNAQGTRTSTVDVTSPKFVRDGTVNPVATKPPETERWRSARAGRLARRLSSRCS